MTARADGRCGLPPAIAGYLGDLAASLPGPRRLRQRVLAELGDHLLSEYEARRADGQDGPPAAAAALAVVGDARTVAAEFAQLRARRGVERAECVTLTGMLAFAALVAVLTQTAGLRTHSPLAVGAAGAIGWFAVQIAVAAGIVAWLRGWRLRGTVHAGAQQLLLSLRAMALAVAAALFALGFDAVVMLGSHPSASGGGALGVALATVLGCAVLAACSVARAAVDVRSLRSLGGGDDRVASALEDLRATVPLGALADRALAWALAHRTATSTVVGAVAGVALAAASLREHGLNGGAHQALLSVAAALVLFVVEAGAVVAAVHLFDRLLRLWPTVG